MAKEGKIKGFKDFIGPEAIKRAKIRKIIEENFLLYGFEPAETPTIESEEFVKGENSDDEAVSETFKLEDRGKRNLALRYEFTFQLKRIARNQKLPYKRYQIGRVFRDEPVTKNRLREFTQCDADVIGSTPKDEVETLALAKKILDELKIDSTIYVNSRKLLNEILVSEDIKEKNRDQVLRELDKLDKLPKADVAKNLKPLGAEKILKVVDKKDFEKYNFYKDIKELIKLGKSYRLELKFQPTLARGLSYYNGTVFEIKTSEMKETICGGGAYEFNDVQSFGFSFGLDRLSMLTKIKGDNIKAQIISINQDEKSIKLAEKLRDAKISTNLILDKTIRKALEYADIKQIEKVIFVGEEEVKEGKYKIKDMKSGKESFASESELVKSLRE